MEICTTINVLWSCIQSRNCHWFLNSKIYDEINDLKKDWIVIPKNQLIWKDDRWHEYNAKRLNFIFSRITDAIMWQMISENLWIGINPVWRSDAQATPQITKATPINTKGTKKWSFMVEHKWSWINTWHTRSYFASLLLLDKLNILTFVNLKIIWWSFWI